MSPTINTFRRSIAVVIGIDAYTHGVPPLRSAVNDAQQLKTQLEQKHGYHVELRIDEQATLHRLAGLFSVVLPDMVGDHDRLLVYFAGHGVALDGDDGPAGYLLPHDATSDDTASFLPMQQLHQWLNVLPCQHMLLILDCCFAGAFRWSSTRHVGTTAQPLYRERYERFLKSPAWQVVTSAAYDQQAVDVIATYGKRSDDGRHSPFAHALFDALQGAADRPFVKANGTERGDGVITATELYSYLRDCVELGSIDHGQLQTPGIWQLNKHRNGEYIFLAPDRELDLPPAPLLTAENNPYRGLESYEEKHQSLFFGRDEQIAALMAIVVAQPLTVVVGASGSGKSSLVKAGLLPKLRDASEQAWQIIGPIRPGRLPQQALTSVLPGNESSLAAFIDSTLAAQPAQHILLVVDQFEELITLCRDDAAREQFLNDLEDVLKKPTGHVHVVITVRSDFEPQFISSALKPWWVESRFVIPPLTQDDLRAIILGPATARVLYFEPDTLVDRIINEVVQTPGALPLLSFTLSELYIKYLQRHADNRALTEADYDQLGGVAGSLRNRATAEYERLDSLSQVTMRRMLLRMVSLEGGEIARKRVPRAELVYVDEAENERVDQIIAQLTQARLIVSDQDVEGVPVVEPAHDALVRGWDLLWSWVREQQDVLVLRQRLTQATHDWQEQGRPPELLWHDDPRLRQTQLESERARSATRQFWLDFTGYVPHPADWLNRAERQFVAASGRRRSRLRQRLVGTLTAVLTIVVSLAIVAWLQRNVAITQGNLRATQEAIALMNADEARTQASAAQTAEARTREQLAIANSQRLAFASQSELATRPDVALAVAYEVTQLDRNQRSEQGLRDVLNALPMTPTFLGTLSDVANVLPSPDGSHFLISSEKERSELWDLGGQRVATFDGYGVAFSPDGKHILTTVGIDTPSLHFYEITGNEIAVFASDGGAFSPDSRYLVTNEYDTASKLYRTNLWNLTGQKLVQLEGSSIGFTPDSQSIVTETSDSTKLWSLSGQPLATFPGKDASIRPDGKCIVTITPEGVRVWQMNGTLALELPGAAAIFSPNNREVLTWDDPGQPQLWNEQGKLVAQFEVEIDIGTSSVAFTPDGRHLLVWSGAGAGSPTQPMLWCIDQATNDPSKDARCRDSDGEPQQTSPEDTLVEEKFAHMLTGKYAAISPDGKHVLTSLRFGGSWLWDLEGRNVATFNQQFTTFDFGGSGVIGWTNQSTEDTIWLWKPVEDSLRAFEQSDDYITDAMYSPDGQRILTSTRTNISQLWSLTGTLLMTFDGGNARFSKDGQRVLTTTRNTHTSIWDIQGRLLLDLPEGRGLLSPDNQHVLTQSKESEYKLRDLDGNVLATLSGDSAAFSLDGQLIVLSHFNNQTRQDETLVYHLSTKRSVTLAVSQPILSADSNFVIANTGNSFDPHEMSSLSDIAGSVRATVRGSRVTFSPDSQRFVTEDRYDSLSYLYDLSGKQLATMAGIDLSYSSDGQYMMTIGYTERLVGSTYGPVYLWDKSGKALNRLSGDGASFTPKGNRIMASEDDGPLRLWSLEGQLLATLPNEKSVSGVDVSPDASRVLTTYSDGTMRQYLVAIEDLQAVAGCRISRPLGDDAIQRLQVPTPLAFKQHPPTCPPVYSWQK